VGTLRCGDEGFESDKEKSQLFVTFKRSSDLTEIEYHGLLQTTRALLPPFQGV
jgi:hypothetical protein